MKENKQPNQPQSCTLRMACLVIRRRGAIPLLRLALICAMLAAGFSAVAQPAPVLTWIPNSSIKLEQVIGDVDWANGSNTTSQTITRFNIVGTDVSYCFTCGTNLIFF